MIGGMDADGVAAHGVDSEVGRLRTVVLHRPGPELKRLTPRNSADLLFDAIPWVEKAQEEHDIFAGALRRRGVEVLYLRDLVVESLAVTVARDAVVEETIADQRLGATLRRAVEQHLTALAPDELTDVLIGGLAHEELRRGEGVVFRL